MEAEGKSGPSKIVHNFKFTLYETITELETVKGLSVAAS